MTGSAETTYAITDIIDDDALWEEIFGTILLSVLPLQATVDACAQALKLRNISADDVVATEKTATNSADDTDMDTVRWWLASTLSKDLGFEQQQLMIVDHIVAKKWETQSTRLSMLMLAVVETANAAVA